MNCTSIAHRRLAGQGIAVPRFATPAGAVEWLGAVQAQDYLGALWAVGLRTQHATEQQVEAAISAGQIVRTWPMRGTIHFIAAADARWMLALLAPRVMRGAQSRLRQLEIDAPLLATSAARSGCTTLCNSRTEEAKLRRRCSPGFQPRLQGRQQRFRVAAIVSN